MLLAGPAVGRALNAHHAACTVALIAAYEAVEATLYLDVAAGPHLAGMRYGPLFSRAM
jgi:uncharacterized protein YyaL (SSP411 family)